MGGRRVEVLRSLSTDTTSIPGTPQQRPKPDVRFLRLVKAVQAGLVSGVRTQLAAGLNVNHRDPALGCNTPLIYAAEYGFVEALVEILTAGASVNIANATGATALHMAASAGHVSTIKLLLAHGGHVDALDAHGSTPLHYAARVDPQEPGCGNLAGVVEALVSAGARCALQDGEGRLPIHNAATAGNAALLKVLSAGKYKATVNLKDNEGRTPLHCAVLSARSLRAVEVLLYLGISIDACDSNGFTALHMAAGRNVNHVDDEFDGACLDLLLNHGASVTDCTLEGKNALSLALERTMWWGRPGTRDHILHTVHQLVAKGSSVQDGFAMWRMVESFPSLVPAALNRSFSTNTSARDSQHLHLKLDFNPLLINQKRLDLLNRQLVPKIKLPTLLEQESEVAMLQYILSEGRKSLLLHPLCHSFLHLKWLRVRKYFLANVVFYFLFVLSLTGFLLASNNCPDEDETATDRILNTTIIKTTTEATSHKASCRWAGEEAGIVGLTWWCLVIFSALLDVREVIQVIQKPLYYIQNIGNLLDAALVLCVPQLLVVGGSTGGVTCCLAAWQQRVGAVSLILAWVRFMLFTGQFPSCGVYIVMFSTVARNVLKFLAMYVFVLVAFALAFHVLLRSLPTFANVTISLITSLVMMTGELDYEATFINGSPPESLALTLLMLVVFIVFVYIILTNLLVGLAVSDMYAIRQRSEMLRLTRHVELMVQVEDLFRSRLVPHCSKHFLLDSISIIDTNNQPLIEIEPNRSFGIVDSLFLFLVRTTGCKRLMQKLFEAVISGFIPPKLQPALTRQLVTSILDVALREHEIDKWEKLKHSRAKQGVPHLRPQIPFAPQPSPATLIRHPSLSHVPCRASWRRTYTENEWEDDCDAQFGLPISTCYPNSAPQVRPNTRDLSNHLEEVRNLVLRLQDTVECIGHSPYRYTNASYPYSSFPQHSQSIQPPISSIGSVSNQNSQRAGNTGMLFSHTVNQPSQEINRHTGTPFHSHVPTSRSTNSTYSNSKVLPSNIIQTNTTISSYTSPSNIPVSTVLSSSAIPNQFSNIPNINTISQHPPHVHPTTYSNTHLSTSPPHTIQHTSSTLPPHTNTTSTHTSIPSSPHIHPTTYPNTNLSASPPHNIQHTSSTLPPHTNTTSTHTSIPSSPHIHSTTYPNTNLSTSPPHTIQHTSSTLPPHTDTIATHTSPTPHMHPTTHSPHTIQHTSPTSTHTTQPLSVHGLPGLPNVSPQSPPKS